ENGPAAQSLRDAREEPEAGETPPLFLGKSRPRLSISGVPFDSLSKENATVRYMLLIYDREADWAALSEKERGTLFQEYMSFTDGIRKSGHYVAGDPLQPTSSATTVRIRNGKTVT